MKPRLTLIAALSADGFISRAQGVPWDLPKDKAHFRTYTSGKWLLLGRKTYDEMRGWFRDHHPLVMTRDAGFSPEIGQRVSSFREALRLAGDAGQDEVVVCGGAQIYAEAMPYAHELILTHVDHILGAGLSFPKIHPLEWMPVARECHAQDAAHAFSFEICTWHRIAAQNPPIEVMDRLAA